MNFGVLVGTRPGIIKMAPIYHELVLRGRSVTLIHTGQHYSREMDESILGACGLPKPEFRAVRPADCVTHAETTAYMLVEIEKILLDAKIDFLFVCGDANTNLAGALAARKLHKHVGHVEAGLRSHDWRMPEEHNRVIIDHISDFLFAPSELCVKNLKNENITNGVFETGNTIVDATLSAKLKVGQNALKYFSEDNKTKVLVTFHREENVDNPDILSSICHSLEILCADPNVEAIWPLHPRTRKRLEEFNLFDLVKSINRLQVDPPANYLQFIGLQQTADIVLTDSGGVQEECCILHTPCVTLRKTTERPETVEVGANFLVDPESDEVPDAINRALKTSKNWDCPYGDGSAARQIVGAVLDKI